MDFLITPRHRWIYVAVLGVMVVNLVNIYPNLNIDNIYLWLFLNLSKSSNYTMLTIVCIVYFGILLVWGRGWGGGGKY